MNPPKNKQISVVDKSHILLTPRTIKAIEKYVCELHLGEQAILKRNKIKKQTKK